LIDGARKVLGTFAPSLSEAAEFHLQKLGVEIHLGHNVEKIDSEGVIVAGERIASKTVIWTAGVTSSPAGKWLGAETDRAGRVRIKSDLSVPGNPEIFVVGDTASLDQDGQTFRWRRPGRDATGTLCREINSSARRRKEKSETVSLFRQR
jgi:NADH dehydrogenase FAD-containing subunit